MPFSNFHGHNQFSLYDGMGSSAEAAKRAKEAGYVALGLTNHGNMMGVIEHYNACKDFGIKPAIGCEIYFEDIFDKEEKRKRYSHMTILAKDLEGYKNLCRMLTEANKNNFYRKACVDFNILEKYKDGIICLSGCISSLTCRNLLGDYDEPYQTNKEKAKGYTNAINNLDKLHSIFGEDFYLEVMPPYGLKRQIDYNHFILNYGYENEIPVLVTLDAHFVNKEDYDTYRIMRSMGNTAKYLEAPDKDHYRFRYLMDENEIKAYWAEDMGSSCSEYIDNTNLVADKLNLNIDFGQTIPKIDWGEPSQKKLIDLAVLNLKKKGKWTQEYKDRLESELDTVLTKGFEDYFLLCYKIVSRAREEGVATNFGRGSVCGSLLAYAIDITNVDPIIFGTAFERFLRPNKNVLPDIDLDFEKSKRNKVFEIISEDFAGRAARISTFQKYKARNLVNDLSKLLNVSDSETKEIKERIEGIEALYEVTYKTLMRDEYLSDIEFKYNGYIKHFSKLYGKVRSIGKHAGGVLITDKNVDEYDGIQYMHSDYKSSHDLEQLESVNLLKMDILSLKNISMVRDIENATGACYSEDILNDRKVYKAFCEGKTAGIFQFEEKAAIDVVKKVRPETFDELCACNALNRPGPKMRISDDVPSGLERYCMAKNGEEDYSDTPWARYCQDTHGVMVYQEQMMWICHEVAKLDWDTTDQIVKNLSKKNEEKRIKLKKPFVDGCIKNGIDRDTAEDFYDRNTLYGFNKGHSVAYTLLGFYCMWLKVNYPLEFWWALLKNEEDEDKEQIYQSCAAREGVFFLIPHVNGSKNYEILRHTDKIGINFFDNGKEKLIGENNKVIRVGMSSIKGVGEKACEFIVSKQPMKSIEEWELCCEAKNEKNRKGINSKVKGLLEKYGATCFTDIEADKYLKKSINFNEAIKSRNKKWA